MLSCAIHLSGVLIITLLQRSMNDFKILLKDLSAVYFSGLNVVWVKNYGRVCFSILYQKIDESCTSIAAIFEGKYDKIIVN